MIDGQTSLAPLGVKFPVIVGPMVGISHLAFRDLVRSFTPPELPIKIFSEMLSTLRLPSERLDLADELQISAADRGSLVPQILGNQEWYIERSLGKLAALDPWGIDINMGCPAKRTLRHNWGVKLMGDPGYAAEVVAMTRRHYKGPLSVKMRCGLKEEDPQYMEHFTAQLEDAGADWLTVHARLQSEGHRGRANWEALRGLKAARSIPVVGNGDIQTRGDVLRILQEFGLDGAMLGRAATARPWILWQVAYDLGLEFKPPEGFSSVRPPSTPEEEGRAYLMALARLLDGLERRFPDPGKNLRRFRFYVVQSHRWLSFGHSIYKLSMKAKSLSELKTALADYQQGVSSFPMSSRVSLL